jgi:transcriptional regulator with XRE-family HTH domain
MKPKEIKEKRIALAMSQASLSEKTGIAQPTISLFENGRQRPTAEQLEKIKAILGEEDEATGSPLAAWLSSARTRKGMSVPELAKKAGVTPPSIYKIESGATLNIHDKTRKKLEKALGDSMDEEVVEEIEKNSKIGLGKFLDFDPHSESDRPTKSGIYVLYDISERPIYVGEGKNIRKRIKDHQDKFWFKRPIVESASWIEIEDEKQRKNVEELLIRFLKSNAVINKQHVERNG